MEGESSRGPLGDRGHDPRLSEHSWAGGQHSDFFVRTSTAGCAAGIVPMLTAPLDQRYTLIG